MSFLRSTVLLAALAAPATASAQVDLDIYDLTDIVYNGAVSGMHAYSVGFGVCNISQTHASWQSSTSLHPVESWGVFRINSGRIEQIGASWTKHGNFAASSPGCGTCNTTVNGSRLGAGCRDVYDATYNSSQFALGPRSDIDAAVGAFPWPPTIGYTQTGNATFKRCQVAAADITASGSIFVVEGLLVHPEDAAAGNDLNNASYRLVSISPTTFGASFSGTTQRNKPAIQAWKDHGLGLNMPDPSILITPVDIPSDGRVFVGSRAIDLGNGLWRYEYAIQNMNSHRSIGGIRIPFDAPADATNLGFHDVSYHSGDIISGTDWPGAFDQSLDALRWSTESFATDPNANAIRWGTLYNVHFESSRPPHTAELTLEFFRPGTPSTITAAAVVPSPPACIADFNTVGGVTTQDIFDYLNAWFASDPAADIDGVPGLTINDVFAFLNLWFAGC